jgi:alkanesulfonate monooxygenase SsuD/methylene tetrahydromethanopterin reductase-like flavin-dependent oxidoreductase (luciferase family)
MSARYGWQPAPEQIIYRANILLAETDGEARDLLEAQRAAPERFPRASVRNALLQFGSRNIAGEARGPMVGGMLATNFCGGPDTVVEQIKRCRDEVGAGVIDLMFQRPDSGDLSFLMRSLELFGKKVLPSIRDI